MIILLYQDLLSIQITKNAIQKPKIKRPFKY